MSISITTVKYYMNKRGNHVDYNPIGSRLKYKRKELNLTLEEGAEDICSVSYLSKVENNMIKPTDKYVEQLKDRYQMDIDLVDSKIYEAELDNMVKLFFEEQPYEKRKTLGRYEDYQEFIRTYAYYVMAKQYDKAGGMFKDMLLFIPNLPMKSLNFLLALASKVLYEDLRYSDSKGILLLMNVEDEDDMMKMIQQKWLLRNAIKLSQVLLFEKIYPSYKEQLIRYQYFNELPVVEMERKVIYQSISGFKVDEKKVKKNEISLVLIKGLYQKYQYKKVIDLTKEKLEHSDFLMYHLLSLDHLNESSKITKILGQIDIQKDEHKSMWLLSRHLKYKYHTDKEVQLNYLRNELLSYKHLTDEIGILYYLMMDAFKIFQKYHFYKEATEVINKYLPMIRELNHS